MLWNGDSGTLTDCVFISNSVNLQNVSNISYVGGGAVYWNGASGNLNNCIFISNLANINGTNISYYGGGAVYWNGDNGTLSDSTFTGNSAINGGAVYWYGNKGKLSYSNFTNNSANSAGAINWWGVNGILTSSNFINNKASSSGAISWSAVNGTMSSSTFINNTADTFAGAIYIAWGKDFCILTNSKFINNTAGTYGGAVYWYGNNGTLSDSIFTGNSATGNGGAVYWNRDNGTLSDSIFTGNSATNDGGAVYWNRDNGTLSDSTFTGNSATGNGGAVYWYGNDGNLTNSTFTGNKAVSGSGGAIYWNNVKGALSDSTFINNSANGWGGGIMWNSANGILTRCTLMSNTAYSGGGAFWNGANGNLTNSIFTSNIATNYAGGGVYWQSTNGTLTGCNFTANSADYGGGAFWAGANGTLTKSTFINNNVHQDGGAVRWDGANSNMGECNFKNNQAVRGNNVFWIWNVIVFLNKYEQLNDYDYVYIRNGVGITSGTPLSNIVLNKKCIIIHGESTVIFDAKGGNVHFEVTGDNVLIEGITFRNFNFTNHGGAILWNGNNGTLKNCNFINNSAVRGGGVYWNRTANNGNIFDSTFNDNFATRGGAGVYIFSDNCSIFDSKFANNSSPYGSAVYWNGLDGFLTGSTFINNTANPNGGGAIYWQGNRGSVFDSTFINNTATNWGGAIYWEGNNGILHSSSFTSNSAGKNGGAIFWEGANGTLTTCTFITNTDNTMGAAIHWDITGSMIDCNFVNNNWIKSNGIYARNNLNLTGGKGIVKIVINGMLSGTSIVVLNNETYYYPPNTNINFINKNDNDRNSILIIKIKSYYMKALVSDNSGTLLERYRAIKDIENDEIFTNINSLNLIDSGEYLNLVVLQFDTTVLLDFPRDMLISDIVHKYKIDFDVSFHSEDVSRTEIAEIIYNDSEATIGDIVDCFMVLKEKIPKIEICNGSALIVDIKEKRIKYTITSAGKLFPSVKTTIEKLQEENIKIFIASGDRKGAIQNLATLLNIPKENAYGTVTTEGKCKIVKKLQNKGFRVLMVGDGLNDILAFKTADISVLTVEQEEEISEKLLDKTDFIIKEFSEIIPIIERDL